MRTRTAPIERPGAIALFDSRSAAPVRDLTPGPERSGAVWTVRTRGGKARRVLRGARQPTWSK